MELPAKIDFNLKEKTGHGFLEYASILAHVLIELPIGQPFETSVPNDPIETVKKKLKEARTLLSTLKALELWNEVDSLNKDIAYMKEIVTEERKGGRPVDKVTVIMFFWARLAKHDGKVPYAMLRTLLRWFYERFKEMGYEYAVDISSITKVEDWSKEARRVEFKKRCAIRHENKKSVKGKMTKSESAKLDKLLSDHPEIVSACLAWMDRGRKPDWKDKHIETIVQYLWDWHPKWPQRKYFPRAVKFSSDSIEVEMDYRKGGKSETLRLKRDLKTRELVKVPPLLAKARAYWPVTFSSSKAIRA